MSSLSIITYSKGCIVKSGLSVSTFHLTRAILISVIYLMMLKKSFSSSRLVVEGAEESTDYWNRIAGFVVCSVALCDDIKLT